MVGLCGLLPEILPVSKLCDFPVYFRPKPVFSRDE